FALCTTLASTQGILPPFMPRKNAMRGPELLCAILCRLLGLRVAGLGLAIGGLCLLSASAANGAQLSEAHQKQVNEAVAKAVAFIKSMQNANVSWQGALDYGVANTALSALALLEGGVPAN